MQSIRSDSNFKSQGGDFANAVFDFVRALQPLGSATSLNEIQLGDLITNSLASVNSDIASQRVQNAALTFDVEMVYFQRSLLQHVADALGQGVQQVTMMSSPIQYKKQQSINNNMSTRWKQQNEQSKQLIEKQRNASILQQQQDQKDIKDSSISFQYEPEQESRYLEHVQISPIPVKVPQWPPVFGLHEEQLYKPIEGDQNMPTLTRNTRSRSRAAAAAASTKVKKHKTHDRL